ncbi:hypothetical protein [Panacibacter ginsenosidivorans]|uniref:hypothetical protein n=1 Tax=Panacibacter ginsenosidivorans TaxID=1813871 RepID=UPI001CEF9141|nr:hypothetical protein [Panacibacter ginsenosidivorans]
MPIKKGYILNQEDLLFRKNIKDISCIGKTTFAEEQLPLLKEYSFSQLSLLAEDGLVQFDSDGCVLTEKGHYFIRNICSAFDLHLQRNKIENEKLLFSKAI